MWLSLRPSSAQVGDAASRLGGPRARTDASALVRHLPRRMLGLETVNVRTSRGTTAGHDAVLPVRRAKRRPGLVPRLMVLGTSTTGALRMQAARSPCTARWPKRRRSSALRGHRPGYRPLDRIATCAGPSGPAERGVRSAGPRDRQAGGRLDGGRVRVRRKKRGPKTKKGRNRFHTDWGTALLIDVVGDDGRPSEFRRRLRPAVVVRAAVSASTPLTRCSIADGLR